MSVKKVLGFLLLNIFYLTAQEIYFPMDDSVFGREILDTDKFGKLSFGYGRSTNPFNSGKSLEVARFGFGGGIVPPAKGRFVGSVDTSLLFQYSTSLVDKTIDITLLMVGGQFGFASFPGEQESFSIYTSTEIFFYLIKKIGGSGLSSKMSQKKNVPGASDISPSISIVGEYQFVTKVFGTQLGLTSAYDFYTESFVFTPTINLVFYL